MAQPSSTVREISRSSGDRLIRVSIANPKGNGFHSSTFPEAEIQSVDSIDEALSALVLRSGTVIPVAVPYEELEQKIYTTNFRTDGPVLDLRDVTGEATKPKAPANTNREPGPGDKMPDGTIFAGVSPDTGKAMYATPADASLAMTFNEAREYAAKLDVHGHKDWHVPTKAELNVLFNNRAAIGEFNVTGSYPAGWYWSSSQDGKWDAWGQRFSDGFQFNIGKTIHASLRVVR
jgi:hypothetical protein